MSTVSQSSFARDLGLVGWQIRYEQRSYWRNRGRGVFTFVFAYLRRFRGGRIALDVQHDLRTAIFRQLQRLDFARHDELVAPSMIVALDGWVDAGSAATTAAAPTEDRSRRNWIIAACAIGAIRSRSTRALPRALLLLLEELERCAEQLATIA